MTDEPKMGDYVLGTRWSDGDSGDPWAVGFLTEIREVNLCRYYAVSHADGTLINGRMYRKVKRITPARGKWLLENSKVIEASGRKMGFWLRWPMKKPTVCRVGPL